MNNLTLQNADYFEADPLPVLLQFYGLIHLNDHQPSQQVDQMADAGGDPQDADDPVEVDDFLWEFDIDDDNDNDCSYSTSEPEESPLFPVFSQIQISCMDDMRSLAVRGDLIFGFIATDIEIDGWEAGFDDMFKFLKLGERFVFKTSKDFEDFWWSSGIRDMVRDASAVLANAPTPPDGFYGPDEAGTPWVATPEHLAASVAGLQGWVSDTADE